MLQASEELFEQVSESDKASFEPSNERDAALAGFLGAVVGKIVLAKGGIKKEEFWSLLAQLGVQETDKDHPKLGNIKNCIDTLKRQQYIEQNSTKSQVDRSITISFQLGVRSRQELIKSKLRVYLDEQMGETLDDDDFGGLCDSVWPKEGEGSDDEDNM